jgi:Trk K+ transport system NAD-binding subunit
VKLKALRQLGPAVKNRVIALSRFLLSLLGLVIVFSLGFQVIMAYEGRDYSWISGLYWTFTTMSTLGFGDIAFVSDLGRVYSIIVLISGIIFMLVLLPFMFIRFVYEPWVQAQAVNRVPRKVPDDQSGHVILTFYGPVASTLINKLRQFNYPYVVVLPDQDEVLALRDAGVTAMCGELDDPETYRLARVENAAMVATTRNDVINTNVVFTVRGITDEIPVFATAREPAASEILKLAGCTRVINLTDLVANALARRAIGGQKFTHVVGHIDDLVIAEVDAARTTLVGQSLGDAQDATAVSVVGVWTRGKFETGDEDMPIDAATTLVMAGSPAQLKEFDANFRAPDEHNGEPPPVVIIGGGRVGRATAAALERRGIDYRVVEMQVMIEAGIETARTVIVTTRDDEVNTYLTIFCRLLRPEIQIIARATLERNIASLHRAGSDMVISSATMGANSLFNLLKRSDLLMVAEGLNVFKLAVPKALEGKTLMEAKIRRRTGCTVIGIDQAEGTTTNPQPDAVLPAGAEIVLIGNVEAETNFLYEFARRQSIEN